MTTVPQSAEFGSFDALGTGGGTNTCVEVGEWTDETTLVAGATEVAGVGVAEETEVMGVGDGDGDGDGVGVTRRL